MFTTKDAALLMSSFSVYKGILHRTVPNAFYRLLCAYEMCIRDKIRIVRLGKIPIKRRFP